MDANTDSESLKELALEQLQESRVELDAEKEWLQRQLDPRRAARHVWKEHSVLLLSVGFVVGLVGASLAWRIQRDSRDHSSRASNRGRRHGKDGRGNGLLGVLLRAAVPALVTHAIARPLGRALTSQITNSEVKN